MLLPFTSCLDGNLSSSWSTMVHLIYPKPRSPVAKDRRLGGHSILQFPSDPRLYSRYGTYWS